MIKSDTATVIKIHMVRRKLTIKYNIMGFNQIILIKMEIIVGVSIFGLDAGISAEL